MRINLNQIKQRVFDGIKGKTPINGTHKKFIDFSQDFSNKANKGLDNFSTNIEKNTEEIVK